MWVSFPLQTNPEKKKFAIIATVNKSCKIFVEDLGICPWSSWVQSDPQLSLWAPSPHSLALHYKPFQILHALLKLSEDYLHHLCFLWRSAEGQYSKEKVLLCMNLMDRLTEVGDRKNTGFSKLIWVLRVTTEFILSTDLKEIYPVEF